MQYGNKTVLVKLSRIR